MKAIIQQCGIALSILALTGCSGMWNEANLAAETGQGIADNQIVAWIPVDQATSPTVVRAMVHVALGKAKQSIESSLCEGQWVFTGNVDENAPPERNQAPHALGAYASWQYRISWNPDIHGCPNIESGEYYRALSENLPRWMVVQSGSEATIYHQGLAVFNGAASDFHKLAFATNTLPDA